MEDLMWPAIASRGSISMARSLLAFAVLSISGLLGAADDLKVDIHEVHSITVPSGKNAGADGFMRPRQNPKGGNGRKNRHRARPEGRPGHHRRQAGHSGGGHRILSDQRYPRVE